MKNKMKEIENTRVVDSIKYLLAPEQTTKFINAVFTETEVPGPEGRIVNSVKVTEEDELLRHEILEGKFSSLVREDSLRKRHLERMYGLGLPRGLAEATYLKPSVCIAGDSGSGKDTFSDFLVDLGFNMTSSSLFAAELFVYEELKKQGQIYKSAKSCWHSRHRYRDLWYNEISKFNTPDGARLGRLIFSQNHIYCGIRSIRELETLRKRSLTNLVIWIDAQGRGVPKEPSTSNTITVEDADLVITNNGSLEELRIKAHRLATLLVPSVFDQRTSLEPRLTRPGANLGS